MRPIEYDAIPYPKWPNEDSVFYAYIDGLSSSQVMYANQASRSVELSHLESGISCKASLMDCNYLHNDDVIYIEFDELNGHTFMTMPRRSKKLYARFLVNHFYFKNLIRSVLNIPDSVLRRLIPQPKDFLGTREGQLASIPPSYLDFCQVQAIEKIVCCQSNVPILITGPYGSGKSRLLSIATLMILDESLQSHSGSPVRILLSCHHQASANTLMTMLLESEHCLRHEFIRVTSETAYRKTESQCINIANFLVTIPKYLRKQYVVVVTTYNTSLRMHTNRPYRFPQGFFTHILIDEGAQSREPECVAPLCMAGSSTHIVIAGDPKQV